MQNAIDASAPDSPVDLRLSADASDVLVEIVDHGRGMSAEYIRRDLFKPFSSSKAGGFGIGAFEARALAQAEEAALAALDDVARDALPERCRPGAPAARGRRCRIGYNEC